MVGVESEQKISAEAAEEQRNSINSLTRDIIAAAMKVHVTLGPGLLESAYEACLAVELRRRGHHVEAQLPLPVCYEGLNLELGYRIDMIVDDTVLLELKACEAVLPVHRAQLTSYLRLSGKKVGLLINFHVVLLKQGITRVVNQF